MVCYISCMYNDDAVVVWFNAEWKNERFAKTYENNKKKKLIHFRNYIPRTVAV